MDSARHTQTQRLYLAPEFGRLEPLLLSKLLDEIVCPECEAPAYFVPPTRRGTTYFGARPHNSGCIHHPRPSAKLAEAIPEAEARLLAKNSFTLRPHRLSQQTAQTNVEHNPDARPTATQARRYTRTAGSSESTASVGLKTLLRKLILEPDFKESDTTIRIETYNSTIHRYVFSVDDLEARHVNKRRLYWGTIYKVTAGEEGNVWLHTRGSAPNLLVPRALLGMLMADNRMNDAEEFVGTAFLTRCYLNKNRDQTGTYLKVNDPRWTVVIPDPDAPAVPSTNVGS